MEAAYDVVIVGGGSAGCVAANRLSADPTIRVCLLEAGNDSLQDLSDNAAEVFTMALHPDCHYDLHTPPQSHLADRSIFLSAGRLLGGNGSTNAMNYVRGSAFDYDGWAKDHGCGERWSWNGVQPIMNSLETYKPVNGADGRGQEGEIDVRQVEADGLSAIVHEFMKTMRSSGEPEPRDYNDGKNQHGMSPLQYNSREGKRHSPFNAFLKPLLGKRENLTVKMNAHVGRIIFDELKRATGVELVDGVTGVPTGEVVHAAKEVILCAGSYFSPKILMLSGVGPKEHLEEVGVKTICDSPQVGKNLHDHVLCVWMYAFGEDSGLARNKESTDWAHLIGFTSLDGTVDEHAPDIQYYFAASEKPLPTLPMPPPIVQVHDRAYLVSLGLLHPKSRGSVTLKSTNAADVPNANPNYLQHPEDRKTMLDAAKWMRTKLSPLLSQFNTTEIGPAGMGIPTDEAWIANTATTFFHPVGTLKMSGKDVDAPVDPSTMKVRGVEGVRVLDASVIPSITSGNTNVPTMTVAAVGANILLSEWRSGESS